MNPKSFFLFLVFFPIMCLFSFRKVKRLAESDSDNDDSALSWVKKVRKKENEKQLAIKRAQLLEEMDEEFGVGELVMNVMGNKDKVNFGMV